MQNLNLTKARREENNNSGAEKSINYACGLMITVTVILLFGLTMLYSTSFNTDGTRFFYNQLLWTCIGLATGSAVFVIGHRRLAEIGIILVIGSIMLLAIADFAFPAVKGAYRWIRLSIGPFRMSIQPSEFAKLAMALFLSKYCAENVRHINKLFRRNGPIFPALVCGSIMLFVLAGRDLGTTLLLAAVMMVVFFVAGMRLAFILTPVVLGGSGLFYLLKNFDPERWSRLTSFVNPEAFQRADGYQLWNSLLALGSGKWFGIGFMESRLKAKYLPEAHTDFILSIVGEELGLISLLLVMAAYLLFAYFALKISLNSPSKQAMLLGTAIVATVILQAIINIGVISGALPTKGMPAPFISYGGSNLLMNLIGVGLLLSIAAENVFPGFHDELLESMRKRAMFFKRKRSS